MLKESTQISQLKDEITRLNAQIKQTAILQQEKNQLEKEYHLSQERFRKVFEKSTVGKKIIDDQLHIIKVNEAFLKILGYPEDEMLGKQITDFSHPDFLEHWKKLQCKLWKTNMSSFDFESCLIKKNGEIAWVYVTSILIENNGKMLGYTILNDISERKELERLREEVRGQEHRQLIIDTIMNTQEERGRIAESLHNGLGQVLFAVKLSLAHVKVKQDTHQPGNEEALRYTERLVANCIDECKRISHDLTPAMLEKHGLKKTVGDICSQLTDSVPMKCIIHGLNQRIDRFLEVAIYRIVQELAMNIVNHAEATQASITITESKSSIKLRVWDNGKGFDEANLKRTGIGLQMMRHKLSLLSGTLKITSGEGEGTTIDISIPKY